MKSVLRGFKILKEKFGLNCTRDLEVKVVFLLATQGAYSGRKNIASGIERKG